MQNFFWKSLALFVPIVILAHLSYWPIWTGYLDSDIAWNSLEADRFGGGEWPIFYHGLWYSGTTFGAVRAFFGPWFPFEVFGLTPYLAGHAFVSFVVFPVMMMIASFWMASKYLNRSGAFAVGLVSAVGFHYWAIRYGVDWYYGCYILGCVLLGIRAGLRNPFLELSFIKLFLIGFLCGLATYTGRLSLLYVLVFWIPYEDLWRSATQLWRDRSRLGRFVQVSVAVLIGLFFWVEFFGGRFEVFGWSFKLHSTPNVKIAGIFLIGYFLFRSRPLLFRNKFFWKRCTALLSGFTFGLGREIFFLLKGHSLPPRMWGESDLLEMVRISKMIPLTFETLFGVPKMFGMWSAIIFSLALLFVGVRFYRDKNWQPILFLVVMCILAYLRVRPHSPGDPRYLFSLYPAALLCLGALVDWSVRKERFLMISVFAGISLHLGFQWVGRSAFASDPRWNQTQIERKVVIETFLNQDLRVVWADAYYDSNQWMFLSSKKIAVINPGLHAKEANFRAKEVKRMGLVYSFSPPPKEGQVVRASGKSWRVHHLKSVGKFHLFEGQRADKF